MGEDLGWVAMRPQIRGGARTVRGILAFLPMHVTTLALLAGPGELTAKGMSQLPNHLPRTLSSQAFAQLTMVLTTGEAWWPILHDRRGTTSAMF